MRRSDDDPTPETSTRRRWAWVTVISIALVSGSALFAVPAIADGDSSTPDPAPAGKVVVCESGVIDHGDGIQTSSASVDVVAADAPVADGCDVAP
jgi:hypothetical protein